MESKLEHHSLPVAKGCNMVTVHDEEVHGNMLKLKGKKERKKKSSENLKERKCAFIN